MTGGQTAVRIGLVPLEPADVVAVADGTVVELAPEALARIRASREVVDGLVAGDSLIYGLNTGLGHMRDERLAVDLLREYQVAIVAGHEGGFGAPLPTRIVRAAMLVRVAGFARGGAGVSPAAVEVLVAMLNRGVHPVVPSVGSVGASDLMAHAAIAIVAAGLGGRAEFGGEILPGPLALERASIAPIRMEPKDGLALISANGISIGHAALVLARARAVLAAADLVVALSLEATSGNVSIVDPAVALAKPVAGQQASATRIRAFLEGSDRCRPGAGGSVQDPLSFRVAPQVHGAAREVVEFLGSAVATELASADDNPLVSIDERRLISNGNFHPMVLALAADAVRPALAHVGQLSDRRMNHLWATIFSRMDPASSSSMAAFALALRDGGGLLRYAAAVRAGELRAGAGPVTLDIAPLDLGVEDHATNAPLAVQRTDEALDQLLDVLAVEVLMARTALRMPMPGANVPDARALGVGVTAAVGIIDDVIGAIPSPRSSDRIHADVRAALVERIAPAAESAPPPG